jgi:hypothetical protein
MTMALCLSCGKTKFGAICPCPSCGVDSTGNMSLDIAFSDHHLAESSLEDFGGVIAHFNSKTETSAVAFWAFIRYISENHGSILQAEVPEEFADQVASIYCEGDIPPVAVKPPS